MTVRPIAGTRPRGADADTGRRSRRRADRRPQGAGRAPDAGGPRPERCRAGGGVRLGTAHGLHDDRAVLARDAPGERGPGTAPARARRRRRAGGLLSRRARCRGRPRCVRCRSSTSWSRCGAVPTPARSATSAGARARSIPPSPSAPASSRATGPGCRPAPESSPTPIRPAEWRETEAKARAVLLALALAGRAEDGAARQRERSRQGVHAGSRPPRCPRYFLPMPTYRLVSSSGDQSFELPPGRSLVVGRGSRRDIAIYDPTISRRHAELTARGDAVEVRDLGSSNGTCINGSRVTTGRLTVNDSVTFGKVTYKIQGRPSLPSRSPREPAEPSDTIVRQLMVSGGGSAGITSRDGPLNRGQLRVAAATGRGAAGQEALAAARGRPEAHRRARARPAAPRGGGHDVPGHGGGPGHHPAAQRGPPASWCPPSRRAAWATPRSRRSPGPSWTRWWRSGWRWCPTTRRPTPGSRGNRS